jgi:hypothetical protein
MKFAAAIRILFVLIIALSYIDQRDRDLTGLSSGIEETYGNRPVSGSLASHSLPDIQHGDDILCEVSGIATGPGLILPEAIDHPVPAPLLAIPSPCWQPPEFRF